jgi:hypothetical protein
MTNTSTLDIKRDEICRDILRAFETKGCNLYTTFKRPFLNRIAAQNRIPLTLMPESIWKESNANYIFVEMLFDELVAEGMIEVVNFEWHEGKGYRTDVEMYKNVAI